LKKRNVISYIIMTFAVVFALFPIYWMVITSIKEPIESLNPTFFPFITFKPSLINWQKDLSLSGSEVTLRLINSVVVAVGSTLIALIIGGIAGYSLTRFRYQRIKNKDILMWILSQIFIPPVVVVIPIFLMFQFIHLLDTPLALIIAHTTFNIPIATLLMRDVFSGIPLEIEESAMIDGCSRLGALRRVVVPLAATAVASAALLCFSFSWNELLFALTLSYERAATVPLLISASRQNVGVLFHVTGVRATIAILPPAVFAIFIQRYIVRGLTFGAVKQ
jgi:multiple sugar transport system permease protein